MPLLDAVASSLTELFAPKIHAERIEGLLANYDFANDGSRWSYFTSAVSRKRREDVAYRSALTCLTMRTRWKSRTPAAAALYLQDRSALGATRRAALGLCGTRAQIPPGAWQHRTRVSS